ncbi:MAG: diguanylate cyclase [Longimicrobiales bacterium]|nr:diguanylate cyclase [Longimicrobiales bacterium]
MNEYIPGDQFRTVLDFAFGIAGRGIPLCVAVLEPESWPPEGDDASHEEAIEALARSIADRTRRTDRVTRAGRARFEALLMDCNRQGAMVFADRLLEVATDFTTRTGVHVVCGVAAYREGMTASAELLAAAERGLERARSSGQGGVGLAPDLEG